MIIRGVTYCGLGLGGTPESVFPGKCSFMDDNIDESNSSYPCPSPFQRRMIWIAATAVSIVVIAVIGVGLIVLGGKVLGFLQPILVPIAVAGIIAYLLDPIISLLRRKTRWKHRTCMLVVYISFLVLIVLLAIAVVVPSFGQAREVVQDWDKYKAQVSEVVRNGVADLQARLNTPIARKYYDSGIDWITVEGPKIGKIVGAWTWDRLMGAFGFFGYLLGLILVPIYLFFFLKESYMIKSTWSDYLPLRASKFKDEVVDTLKEVNQYLISFFRGQMVVSLIDGALVAIALSLVLQLPYALLIGVFLAILGLIPYIGNVMVMIPAVLIAIAHFSHKTPIDYPLTLNVTANEVRVVPLPGGNRKKYISDVTELTLVTVQERDGRIATGSVPYVSEPTPETVEAEETAVEGELVDAGATEMKKPVPAAVGIVMDVRMENGVVERREIHSIIKSVKRGPRF